MLASAIVIVVLRLYCVSWLVQGVAGVVSGMAVPFGVEFYLYPIALIVLAVVLWLIAPALARLVLGKHETTIPCAALSLEDMYAFAFLFLGLYFVLNSVGDVLNWLHFWLKEKASGVPINPERQVTYYDFSRTLITAVAALFCIFGGKKFARKLAGAGK